MTIFEFDAQKSGSNRDKHGIDFITAQALWKDDNRLEIASLYVDEPRLLVIGKISGKLWTASITYRNESIRIISVRRARKKEEIAYEKNNGR